MVRLLLALAMSCLAQACLSVPSLTAFEPTADTNTVTIPISYSQWFDNSTAFLSVNDTQMSLTAGSANFVIAPPADGRVVIKTSNPLGLDCVAPRPMLVTQAELGVVIPCATMLRFTTQQPASYVLGQPDMTSARVVANGPYANDMNLPWGLAANAPTNPNWLFVADELFNRVLAYRLPIMQNQPDASFVLGQGGNFSGTDDAASQSTMSQPLGLDIVDDTLVVADANNNRVLIFHGVPSSSTAVPDTVVGQPTFSTASTGCDGSSLAFPFAAIQAGGRLYVADTHNSRVLMWLTTPQGPMAPPADGAIGQPSLTDCATISPPTSQTLNQPRGLHWDGSYFYILDSSNNRVLIYEGLVDSSSTPSYLIGQPNYKSNQTCAADTCLATPKGVVTDANNIFVLDTVNNRIFGFYRSDVYDSILGAPPRPYLVLGQASTTDASSFGDPNVQTSVTFNNPSAAVILGSRLYVSDTFNFRVLVFESQ